MNMYSMPGYFQNMPTIGKELVNPNPENEQEIKAVESDIHESVKKALDAGINRSRYMVPVKQPFQS